MASVTPALDQANGVVGKPASKGDTPKLPAEHEHDVVDVEEGAEGADEDEEGEEDDEYEVDDEEDKQIVGDEDDEEDGQEDEAEGQEQEPEGKGQPSLTNYLLQDPEDNDEEEEFSEEETEDVYIPAAEPMSRKRSIQEVPVDDDEPDSKKIKA